MLNAQALSARQSFVLDDLVEDFVFFTTNPVELVQPPRCQAGNGKYHPEIIPIEREKPYKKHRYRDRPNKAERTIQLPFSLQHVIEFACADLSLLAIFRIRQIPKQFCYIRAGPCDCCSCCSLLKLLNVQVAVGKMLPELVKRGRPFGVAYTDLGRIEL